MMNIKKIKLIDEIISSLAEDSTASTMLEDLTCICHAPHLGYRFIFKYLKNNLKCYFTMLHVFNNDFYYFEKNMNL